MPRDHAISILRSAMGAIADELVSQATSTASRDRNATILAYAGRDIAVLAEACGILERRFTRRGL